MRALLQRVSHASVVVETTSAEHKPLGAIGPGLLILFCAMQGDTLDHAHKLAAKIAKMRLFKDAAGKMNLSVRDTGGSALIISQFTLAADLRGNRPGFSTAAQPEQGRALYEAFVTAMRDTEHIPTQTGCFGADMAVSLVNDGPVTIWIDL